jgi:hypothetical protein
MLSSVALAPASAWAQEEVGVVVWVDDWGLQPHQLLRVYTRGIGRAEGPFLRISDQQLILGTRASQTVIPLQVVDSLWVRSAGTQRGAILGGVGGSVIGAILGLLACDGGCDAQSVVLGVVIGGAGGAIGGGLFGSTRTFWDRRYP